MSSMNVNLSGAELADYLAATLTDLEFELLVRKRVTKLFESAHANNPGFGESHNSCRYIHNWHDKSEWAVGVGTTYTDKVDLRGEVLRKTLVNACMQYDMQHGNKLSLLLPAPKHTDITGAPVSTFDDDNDPF